VGIDRFGRASTGASKREEVPSNPFAAPVEERRALVWRTPKPLSLWLGQIWLSSQLVLGVIWLGQFARHDRASLAQLCPMSLFVLACLVIVIGVQGRARWAHAATIAMLACQSVAVVVVDLLGMRQGHWAQDQLGLQTSSPDHSLLSALLLGGGLTAWIAFGRRSRQYFQDR
jgi:hypothetical protein